MINRTEQTWEVGRTVRVGFLRLTIHSFIPKTDVEPDGYLLMGLNGQSYLFRPHCGIARI